MAAAMLGGCLVATVNPDVEHATIEHLIIPLSRTDDALPADQFETALGNLTDSDLKKKALNAFVFARNEFTGNIKVDSVLDIVHRYDRGARGYIVSVQSWVSDACVWLRQNSSRMGSGGHVTAPARSPCGVLRHSTAARLLFCIDTCTWMVHGLAARDASNWAISNPSEDHLRRVVAQSRAAAGGTRARAVERERRGVYFATGRSRDAPRDPPARLSLAAGRF
jgi:hypothetical protein